MRSATDEIAGMGRVRFPIGTRAVERLAVWAQEQADAFGRVTPSLQRALTRVERAVAGRWTEAGAGRFQELMAGLGARQGLPIRLPDESTPLWLAGGHPLGGFRSASEVPRRADVVVVGAGLTGSSAALHLAAAARRGLRVVVLDRFDPGTQASGRNGGNFELIPENFRGEYEGLPVERRKWLAHRYPGLASEVVAREAVRQARLVLEFGQRNSRRFLELVREERIECDVSASGWLRIADTAAESRALGEEVRFAAECGVGFELWSAERIRRELGIPARYQGRLARRNGNYHPFKFVCGALERAIEGGVRLFARTPVTGLERGPNDRVTVETALGRVEARCVILATNAFTVDLVPELEAIRYYQSQILTLSHVENTLAGMTVTEKKGDLYYNFPRGQQYVDGAGCRRGTLLVGGGLDRPGEDPARLRRSRAVFDLVLGQTDERFPATRGQAPTRLWTGPMAFTPDRLPAIGFLRRAGWPGAGLVVAAGFNGYGGTYCVEAGRLAARMALSGRTPAEVPEEVFSPGRFLTRAPLFRGS